LRADDARAHKSRAMTLVLIASRMESEAMAVLKLLVVEDDAANLELMTELLEQLKAEVRPLGDSQEAAALIQREKFDGIFLDLTMPAPSGFELAKLVRESACNNKTPIVIVTGRDEKDTMHLSFSLGATYFLQKPLDAQQLAPLLERVQKVSFENRRRCIRAPLTSAVTCTVGERTLNGVVWNLSQGGIQIEVAGLEIGDIAQLSFILPHPALVIKAQGVVVWAQEGRQGLHFSEMNVEDQEAVRDYVLRA
jgi:CheY-like chemotaxis protein